MNSQNRENKNRIVHFTKNALPRPFAVTMNDILYVDRQQKTTFVEDRKINSVRSLLQQNFPNPFNKSTVIRYSVDQQSDISIKVYDMSGKEIFTLVKESKQAGTFSIGFANTNIASGTYFYRLIAKTIDGKTTVETKNMVVMK